MPYSELENLLMKGAGLSYRPVGLAYVADRPASVPAFDGEAPTACSFWRKAEEGVFYAADTQHYGCPIGLMTQGFEVPAPQMQELMDMVGEMCSASYIDESEVAFIPKVKKEPKGIVYGPLGSLPVEPDVALFWATPQQAMLLQEAAGGATWAQQPGSGSFGRPACGALPIALESGHATISLGCAGMRTFTEIPADRLLIAVPGPMLAGLEAKLQTTLTANEHMLGIYRAMKGA